MFCAPVENLHVSSKFYKRKDVPLKGFLDYRGHVLRDIAGSPHLCTKLGPFIAPAQVPQRQCCCVIVKREQVIICDHLQLRLRSTQIRLHQTPFHISTQEFPITEHTYIATSVRHRPPCTLSTWVNPGEQGVVLSRSLQIPPRALCESIFYIICCMHERMCYDGTFLELQPPTRS